ncbi:MAG: hypothetical protein E7676_06550 [Ruminococcaceae bacterium]|nr:hypothetical protein [Oscillospiraceae bacterium]
MNNEEKNIQAEQPEEVKKATFGDWWKKLATGAKAGIIAALSVVVIVPIVLVIALGGNGDNGGNGDGGNGGDGDKSIVVTVVDDEGNAVKDVEMSLITAKMPLPQKQKTDADGKVTTTNKEVIKVKITKIPAGYSKALLNEEQSIPADGKLTINLEKLPEWVIRVVDQDNNAVVGAMVMMCELGNEGNCKIPVATDDNGCGKYLEEGEYKAKISSLPDGYTADLSEYHPFDGHEVVIKVTKIAE